MKIKAIYLYAIIVLFLLTSCSKMKDDSDSNVKLEAGLDLITTEASDTEISLTNTPNTDAVPTVLPDLPPYIIQIDRIWYSVVPATDELPKYSLIDPNIDFSCEGTVDTYTGNVYKMPSLDNQTNYDGYLNHEYGYINGNLYLKFLEYKPLEKARR